MNTSVGMHDDPSVAHGVGQCYATYSDVEQKTWRNAMNALVEVLDARCAVPYKPALKACGLTRDHIPRQSEIDVAIGEFGWTSVMVDSFIPPPEFMYLQAKCTIPITRFVRAATQVGYTPIPDIIHEAAGHLPMLTEPNFRRFMQRFGEEGQALSFSELDLRVYESQKVLAEYASREAACQTTLDAMATELGALRDEQQRALTPACMVSRFHWWTVEYGLIGEDAKIFGAGLLSSSQEALATDATHRLRLSLDCLDYPYEISRMQPQLFVVDDWDHLNDQFDQLMRAIS